MVTSAEEHRHALAHRAGSASPRRSTCPATPGRSRRLTVGDRRHPRRRRRRPQRRRLARPCRPPGSRLQQPGPSYDAVLVGAPDGLLASTSTPATSPPSPTAPARRAGPPGACVFGAWSGGLGAVAVQCGSQDVNEKTSAATRPAWRSGSTAARSSSTTPTAAPSGTCSRTSRSRSTTGKPSRRRRRTRTTTRRTRTRPRPTAVRRAPSRTPTASARVVRPCSTRSTTTRPRTVGCSASSTSTSRPAARAWRSAPTARRWSSRCPRTAGPHGSTTSSTTAATASRPTPPSTSRCRRPAERAAHPARGLEEADLQGAAPRRARRPGARRLARRPRRRHPAPRPASAVGGEESGAAARTTADGRIRFTAPSGAADGPQLVRVEFAVTDGRSAPVTKSMSFQVQAPKDQKAYAPQAEPDVVRGEVKPIKIRPLLNDLPGSDPNAPDAELSLGGKVPQQPDAKVVTDLDAGQLTFTGDRAGTYFLSYDAGFGNAPLDQGTIRVDVKARPKRAATPSPCPTPSPSTDRRRASSTCWPTTSTRRAGCWSCSGPSATGPASSTWRSSTGAGCASRRPARTSPGDADRLLHDQQRHQLRRARRGRGHPASCAGGQHPHHGLRQGRGAGRRLCRGAGARQRRVPGR